MRRVLLFGVIASAMVAAAMAFRIWRTKEWERPRTPRATREASPPEVATAAPEQKEEYVGSQACASCHSAEYASYLQTAHSRSFSEVDPQSEPEDVVFQHAPSGRTYEVFRRGSQLIHRESMKASDADEPIAAEYPVKYLVGSGRHTRSYLIEDASFLAESPITWYSARKKWDMSPGYDRPEHRGFERATDMACLTCHLGRVDRAVGSDSRPKILELAIGCERCHGPGGKHVAERKKNRSEPSSADARMVHPAHLSRDLAESICAECHLRGDATVSRRGKHISGFRPGMPLHDFHINYHVRNETSGMKVVGHVEQMRLSRCYVESGKMTCTTCHDPHGSPNDADKIDYYRKRCLSCHEESCKLDESTRRMKTAEDNCVVCHMPQSDTDIRHIAFTHHRIGLHSDEKPSQEPVSGQLAAMDMPNHVDEVERNRNLGLAYLELSDRSPLETSAGYRQLAFDLMLKAYNAGETDGEMLAALARIYWEQDSVEATGYAAESLRDRTTSERSAANALLILGEMNFRGGNLESAQASLSRLVKVRRQADDWMLLAATQKQMRKYEESLKSYERAAAISPFRSDIQQALADAYRAVNQNESARKHEAICRQLITMQAELRKRANSASPADSSSEKEP